MAHPPTRRTHRLDVEANRERGAAIRGERFHKCPMGANMSSDSRLNSPTTMRDKAVALAKLGYRVFKLREYRPPTHRTPEALKLAAAEAKRPAVAEFYARASSDLSVVYEMWSAPITGEPLDSNVGIETSDIFVIDVDVKDGKQGAESLERLVEMGLDIDTREAISPTGSRHLHYKLPQGKFGRCTTSKLGPGIDTRSWHGYVAGPGSIIDGREYRWVSAPDKPMLTLPDWILAVCERSPPDKRPKVAPLVQLDQDSAITRAVRWLTEDAPEAIEGCGGNNMTFQVAAKLKDYGVSQATAYELMLDWNEEKAIPPWDWDELEKIVGNAYRYGSSPPGIRSADADFAAIEGGPSIVGQLWGAAQDPRGTPAEHYLASRRINLTDEIAATVVRYHPQCQWQDNHKPIPALLVALRAIADGEIESVLRIRLDRRKRWPMATRRVLGPVHGVAAMFDQVKDDALILGVDVETCLAARQLGLRPIWAVGSVRTIAAFPLVPDVTDLRILGEPGSLEAIGICVARWRDAGRCVRVAIPDPAVGDFNKELPRSKQP